MHKPDFQRFCRLLVVCLALIVPEVRAQRVPVEMDSALEAVGNEVSTEGGFVITNASGDTLLLAMPDHLIQMGKRDSSIVTLHRLGRGLEARRAARQGHGLSSILSNPANNGWAIAGQTTGNGAGVFGITSVNYVPNTWGTGVLGYSSGSGFGVTGWAGGGGIGGFFFSRGDGFQAALVAETAGEVASALVARRWNANPEANIAIFGTGQVGAPSERYVAGIKGNGDIWSRGNIHADGTITSGGADFAERFEVIGDVAAYEPGDVLQISPDADRHLELATEPYSRRIAGVYATKPGVLLGTLAPETSVPLGVVGVVPTKVTGEGGPIFRGDLLVTSSTPGHAMKGDPEHIGVGMVIGRALQAFDGEGHGLIEVLVNVQ
jgi:hypothetical protein